MIQKNLLKKAGIAEKDISNLEIAWEAFQKAKNQPVRRLPHIVCTGVYNAGKSTLLNALLGEEKFPTGDIPTTKAVAKAEFDGAVYIDTPGLNAAEEDDRETQNAYETTDFILFVSNAQNGGVSEAEAVWLQKLRDRYTQDGLKQRMIYVLTQCGQVDQEQLPSICERVQNDIGRAVGFTPEQVFCVDSVTYLDGKTQNEPLLIKHSGISKLQSYLSNVLAYASRTLQNLQTEEINARSRELREQITCCKDSCERRLAEISTQRKRGDVEALFAKAEEKIEDVCKQSAYVESVSVYVSYGTTRIKRMGVTSPFTAEADAKKELNRYYERCMSEAKSKLNNCLRNIERTYGATGMGSPYFKSCNTINGALEELLLDLSKLGVSLNKVSEIHIDPDSDELSRMLQRIQERYNDLEFYDGTGIFNTCYDVYGNRFRSMDVHGGHYKKTLFGEKYVEDIGTEIEMWDAMRDASEGMNEQTSRFREYAKEEIDHLLKYFLKDVKKEANKRLKEMRIAAKACIATTIESAEAPLRAALDYLSALTKEATL